MPEPVSAVAIHMSHPTWTPMGGSAGDFQEFSGIDAIRELTVGGFKLIHEWDDRTSVGDDVAQMRPNEFENYDNVTIRFVTERGAQMLQKFLEHCEANLTQPFTIQWTYSSGNLDSATFGIGEIGNPFENKKVVMTEVLAIAYGSYTKTRA